MCFGIRRWRGERRGGGRLSQEEFRFEEVDFGEEVVVRRARRVWRRGFELELELGEGRPPGRDAG